MVGTLDEELRSEPAALQSKHCCLPIDTRKEATWRSLALPLRIMLLSTLVVKDDPRTASICRKVCEAQKDKIGLNRHVPGRDVQHQIFC